MPNVVLEVPLVWQQHGYDGQLNMGRNYAGDIQPRGNNGCWYACVCMLSYYFRPGPRLGLPSVWRADVGIHYDQLDWLARTEGLERLEQPEDGFTRDFIAETLIARGPILAMLRRPLCSEILAVGHMIVLTGLVEDMLHYNDPYYPAPRVIYFHNRLFYDLFVKNRDWL
ncbi:papain-like cysteine protease family protein [Bradyrhizobium sp. ARR65]|uniref:papain-like cysteine protease family protein n=1 Tax=Bradyrhizobium sp. ARR65 TaxID=1040989 RepID=UPI0009FF2FE7|nr:papain-like cysteine protease family protein [Bradyrhizobium sp. ARR65]